MDESTERREHAGAESDGLISRLQLIEGQPLAERATHYGQLHDELAAALEQRDGRLV